MCMLQIRYPQARTGFLLLFPISSSHSIPIRTRNKHITSICYKLDRNSNAYSITRDPQDHSFNFDAIIDYGPSLGKGRKLHKEKENNNNDDVHDSNYLDKESFARVFDVAALRVSAEECHGLQARLKGHLLNWPRIQNIARVPGDDVDPDFEELFNTKEEDEILTGGAKEEREEDACDPALAERVKIAEKFNSRGFKYFRKLAHISRPKKKKKKEEERGLDYKKRRWRKEEFAAVEVVGDENGEDEEDLRGLLGEDYKIRRWTGPTRLLLLDERHARKAVSELPQAVQVAAFC